MPTWNSRGLRGSSLEELINYSNEKYRDRHLALIQKIPTPIKPVQIDQTHRHITLAYFDQKSTVDYIGAVQGIPVCFDAKECGTDTFPLQNIHAHQVRFMEDFERQGGISFLIIHYTHRDQFVYLPFRALRTFWDRKEAGGRKSFLYTEVDLRYEIHSHEGVLLHYLEAIQTDLTDREKMAD